MTKGLISQEIIDSIVKRLIRVYEPESIYLYGSYAWGNPTEYSDIDLCVLLEYSDQKQAERIRTGLRELRGTGYPVDILVLTKGEIEEHKNHPSTLIHKVLNKGKKLYEAA